MNEEAINEIKKNMIAIGRLLWEKELASGLNGNISVRVDDQTILMTATKTCLGLLHEKDILRLNLADGTTSEGAISTEASLHMVIYKNFPNIKSVVHTHTTFTNAFFLENDFFSSRIYEAKIYLGEVHAVEQTTPSVTDVQPVIDVLNHNNITVLRKHGVVAIGEDLFDCFLLIQGLEDAVKVEAFSKIYRRISQPERAANPLSPDEKKDTKKYDLFSSEQISEIVRLVNEDKQLQDLGQKTKMSMSLAVLLNETQQVYNFIFENGKIVKVGSDSDAEFLISASEKIWRSVFNREIDPFVATTQKKMHLRGDFAKISKWYAPCSRIFELWQKVPVK